MSASDDGKTALPAPDVKAATDWLQHQIEAYEKLMAQKSAPILIGMNASGWIVEDWIMGGPPPEPTASDHANAIWDKMSVNARRGLLRIYNTQNGIMLKVCRALVSKELVGIDAKTARVVGNRLMARVMALDLSTRKANFGDDT